MNIKQRSVAILIFDDVELLDFAGPYEVFSAVRLPSGNRDNLMDVWVVAETMEPVRCRNGLVVQPEYNLDSCPPFDILVIPGGVGTRTAVHQSEIIKWIQRRSRTAELITSVCTGSFLLAEAGLVSGGKVTTHWTSIRRLQESYPDVKVVENTRWVDSGQVISSAGVSAGIDMALHIVERLYGKETASSTARWIEYDYWGQPDKVAQDV